VIVLIQRGLPVDEFTIFTGNTDPDGNAGTPACRFWQD
jgi:hypothetical protein